MSIYFKAPVDKLVQKLSAKFGFKEFNPSQQMILVNNRKFVKNN